MGCLVTVWPRRHDYEVIRLEAKKKALRWNVEAHNSLAKEEDEETASHNDRPLLLKSLVEHNFPVRISNRISSPTQAARERQRSFGA